MRPNFLLLFILLSGLVSATPELFIQNADEIKVGETILGKISTVGEFTEEISKSQMEFYEGRKKVFFEYDLTSFNGTYYFYAYTTRAGNFTIKVSQILFKESGSLSEATLEKNIEIISPTNESQENSILQLKPGFSKFQKTPSIKLINKGNINLKIKYEDEELELEPGATNEATIFPDKEFYLMNISTYKNFQVPILSYSKIIQNGSVENSTQKNNLSLKTNPSELTLNLVSGNESKTQIELFNFAKENITELKITSSLSFLSLDKIENIDAKTAKNLTITSKATTPGVFSGVLKFSYKQNNSKEELSVFIMAYILPKGTNISQMNPSEKSCSEISGTVCVSGENCNGTVSYTKNLDKIEYCCVGSCVKANSSSDNNSSYGWIVGIILIVLILVGGYFVVVKAKKTKPISPNQSLKQTTENYTKRISGGLQRN